ncbi:hypothetical protein N8801_01555 [Alphaproteobacteria bacterium]|nr:hypothetical protein [Alphaproteobacteria bacterium]
MIQDKKPKNAGKNIKSSILVSPCLCPISSRTKSRKHKKRTKELIFPNFFITDFIIYLPSTKLNF